MILDGYLLAEKIKSELKVEVAALKTKNIIPKLVVIQIGNTKESEIYLKVKKKACLEVGIEFKEIKLPKNTPKTELKQLISTLNNDKKVSGIIIQYPIPNTLKEVVNYISPTKDVDGLTNENKAKLYNKEKCFIPCTALGIIKLLKHYQIEINGKHVVIIGRSQIVGLPLSLLFLQENASLSIIHSKTKDKAKIIQMGDIVVSAIGKPKFITKEMIKEKAIVIDVGINYLNGKIIGDVDFANIKEKASFITPVPRGVGPMTVATLLENVIKACQ